MDFWATRKESIEALGTELRLEAAMIYEGLETIDDLIGELVSQEGSNFTAACAITLIKARNFVKGCFSLSLDGLAQESGALLRPMIECLELLTYFRQEPERAKKAFDRKLPSAGRRAEKINGNFKELRKHLNECASHFSFKEHSLRHLFDSRNSSLKIEQQYDNKVLKANISTLCLFIVFILCEGANCLVCVDHLTDEMGKRVNAYKEKVKNRTQLIFINQE